jgi:hypothetical protein
MQYTQCLQISVDDRCACTKLHVITCCNGDDATNKWGRISDILWQLHQPWEQCRKHATKFLLPQYWLKNSASQSIMMEVLSPISNTDESTNYPLGWASEDVQIFRRRWHVVSVIATFNREHLMQSNSDQWRRYVTSFGLKLVHVYLSGRDADVLRVQRANTDT